MSMQTLASVKEKCGLINGEIDIEIQMGRARVVVVKNRYWPPPHYYLVVVTAKAHI